MIGPEKLSTIRTRVRKSFRKSDAGLLAWFNRQLGDLRRKPKANGAEMETLRLLRDALLQEAKRPPQRRKSERAADRSKT